MPKEGVRSVWRFAAAFTTACVVVKLSKHPADHGVVSKVEKDHGPERRQGRQGAGAANARLMPFRMCRQVFNLKKHHGRAEAALLAVYASQLNEARNYDDQS